ncbi:hypothetical protein E3N88_04877 [Mikania micrantha]|uniref:Uncharacterized protein n=1 Tax=Mikania micrantha TaxID=192012 RepID=A0A5N6PVN8_9ASTR|nr:hypothetical protein E3N88_04877 [Mikania micrantha]
MSSTMAPQRWVVFFANEEKQEMRYKKLVDPRTSGLVLCSIGITIATWSSLDMKGHISSRLVNICEEASISISGNSTVTAMDSSTINYPTPIFYSFKANSLVLALFLIAIMEITPLPLLTDTWVLIFNRLISLDIDSLISYISYVQDQKLYNVKTNTFPTWCQDDCLSLSRCNDYHKKINSVEDTGKLTDENHEIRIAEQPREFGFEEVKLGSFGTCSHKTPKIQTATVGTGKDEHKTSIFKRVDLLVIVIATRERKIIILKPVELLEKEIDA